MEQTKELEQKREPEQLSSIEIEKQKKHKSKKKRIIIISLIVSILALCTVLIIGYMQKVTYYETHYFPNTFINNMDCSGLNAQVVSKMMDTQAQEYSLTIWGRDAEGNQTELGVIQGADIALKLVDSLSAANDILEEQDEMRWYETWDETVRYGYSVVQGVTFDEQLLKEKVESLEALQKKNMIAPVDAYIGDYLQEKNEYELVPEVNGTQLDVDAVISCVAAAVYGNAVTVDLEEHECYTKPEVTSENEELVSNLNDVNQWLKTNITYSWNTFEVKLDTSVIKEWISVVDNKPVLDEAAVAEFVADNARKYDTYGKTRKFVTALGVELSLPSGAFGWLTDRETETEELIELIKQGSVSEREPVYSHKAPWKGMSDIGNSYVEADLTNQHLYLYHKGNLVLETDFVSGDMSRPNDITPAGVFGLTYKTMNAVLRGADYETPVTYWMPFHGNFGMHDATWREEFGGDFYITGEGSHGCLNLPFDKAAEIYNYMYEGHPIICYYY